MDTLFGEGQSGLKVVLFVIVVLGLLALAFWLLRRFGGGRLGTTRRADTSPPRTGATPANCQSNPTVPRKAEPVS